MTVSITARLAPATFQRLMDLVLSGLQWVSCLVYMYLDEVIIFGKSFEEHLKNMELVFARIREAGLKLKTIKVFFLSETGEASWAHYLRRWCCH